MTSFDIRMIICLVVLQVVLYKFFNFHLDSCIFGFLVGLATYFFWLRP